MKSRWLLLGVMVIGVILMAGQACDQNGGDDKGKIFTLTSPAFQDGGELPVDYTCDGAGYSPPLQWAGQPKATVEFALMMTTIAKDGEKWNWVLYDIPSDVPALAENSSGVGINGLSSDGPELVYYPPCSQGPGPKTYTFTIHALSQKPVITVPADHVSGAVLTSAISQITLASSQINVSYTRPVTQ